MNLQEFLTIFAIVGNTVLFVLYAFVLLRMHRGTKFKLFMTIIILLMCCTAFAILNWISADEVNRVYYHGANIVPWGTVNAIAYGVN